MKQVIFFLFRLALFTTTPPIAINYPRQVFGKMIPLKKLIPIIWHGRHLLSCFCLSFLCLAYSPACGQANTLAYHPDSVKQKVDLIFSDWDRKDGPGGAVAVLHQGKLLIKKGYGMADIAGGIQNAPSTPFNLASMAKQFTAMCIALLEEQGKLSVEDRIHKFYPQFKLPTNIKIKNLLDHTSGIREAYVLAILSGKVNLKGQVPKRYQTKEFLFKVLSRETELNFAVGSEMVYTNINYILLGDIVEKVSGQKLRVFADSAIFKPLNMKSTFFNDQESSFLTVGYHLAGKKYKKKTAPGGIVGDHNLISTVEDLIIWNNNFYHNALEKKDQKIYKKLFTSSKLNNGENTNYGYGVNIGDYKSHKQIYHGGDDEIHTTIMIRIPDKSLEVICLANSSDYNDTKNKAYQIIDSLLGLAASPSQEKTPEHFSYTILNKEQLSKKVGLYFSMGKDGLGRLRKVSLDDDNLFISSHFLAKGLQLNATSENKMVAVNSSGNFLHFNFKEDFTSNNVTLTEKYLDKPELHFQKCKKTSIRPGEYKGIYYNQSTGAKIKVTGKKNEIKARKGIIPIPLLVMEQNLFYATENDAVFLFDRNSSGKVVGLKINARDFRNFKLKKLR